MREDFESERNNYRIDVDDPCVAVSGYKPRDDERICKFYKRDGRCWKKSCTMEHVKVNPDVFTTDVKEVYQNAFNKLYLPANGSRLTLKVTAVISPTTFFAQIGNEHGFPYGDSSEEQETLKSLMLYLNDPENIASFQPLECPPTIGEIVLVRATIAKIKVWLRARINDIKDDSYCSVFYVDFGTEDAIKLAQICEMQPRFLHLPFQAIECTIGNVEYIGEENTDKAFDVFRNLIEKEILTGIVVETCYQLQKLELLLKGENGTDIGDKMVASGYYKLLERSINLNEEENYIPG